MVRRGSIASCKWRIREWTECAPGCGCGRVSDADSALSYRPADVVLAQARRLYFSRVPDRLERLAFRRSWIPDGRCRGTPARGICVARRARRYRDGGDRAIRSGERRRQRPLALRLEVSCLE